MCNFFRSLFIGLQARNVICMICRNPFLCTVKLPELQLHHANKHSKSSFADCFPQFAADSAAGPAAS